MQNQWGAGPLIGPRNPAVATTRARGAPAPTLIPETGSISADHRLQIGGRRRRTNYSAGNHYRIPNATRFFPAEQHQFIRLWSEAKREKAKKSPSRPVAAAFPHTSCRPLAAITLGQIAAAPSSSRVSSRSLPREGPCTGSTSSVVQIASRPSPRNTLPPKECALEKGVPKRRRTKPLISPWLRTRSVTQQQAGTSAAAADTFA